MNTACIAQRTAIWLPVALILVALSRLTLQSDVPEFQQFYLAGKMAAAGEIAHIHDGQAYEPYIADLRRQGVRPAKSVYWNRPAYIAYLYTPFAFFPYSTSAKLPVILNAFMLFVLVWRLPDWFSVTAYRAATRVLLALFFPFTCCTFLGQDAILLTLLASYSVHLSSRGFDRSAGIVLGLTCFKPHLIFLTPVALLLSGKWRTVASFVATAAVQGVLWLWLVGVSGMKDWLALIQAPTTDMYPDRMGNIRALYLTFGAPLATVAVAILLICAAIILWRGSYYQKLSAMLLAGLLAGPHAYIYDYSLAGLIAVLSPPPSRWLLLVPWPLVYTRPDMAPMIFLGLLWLAANAAPLMGGKFTISFRRRQPPRGPAYGVSGDIRSREASATIEVGHRKSGPSADVGSVHASLSDSETTLHSEAKTNTKSCSTS